jgi:hypothetical protein
MAGGGPEGITVGEPTEHARAASLPRAGWAARRAGIVPSVGDIGDHGAGGQPLPGESASPPVAATAASERPLTGEDAVAALYAYVQTAEFRRGFEAARGLNADELADRRRRRQQERARQAAEAIAALRASE